MTTLIFRMRIATLNGAGYNVEGWDNATPLTVRATDRDEAFKKAWAAMGAPPNGRRWTARIFDISECSCGDAS